MSGFNVIKEIKTKTVSMRLLDTGVVLYTYILNSEVDEQEHLVNHNALVELVGKGNKSVVLVDSEGQVNVTSEARKLVRELELAAPISFRAIVVRGLSQRMVANFYITFYKPLVPTKIFNEFDEALKWLTEKRGKKDN